MRWVRVTGMAVVIVALVALVVGSGWLTHTTHAPLVASGGSIATTPGPDASRQPDTASIQRVFVTTPGGTRIVWVLNPHFAF